MKVYEVLASGKPKDQRFEEYASLVADDEVWDAIAPEGEAFKGIPLGREWTPRTFYFEKPLEPKSNFLYLCCDAFVCDERARELAGEPLEMAGEFLPINIEKENGNYWIYNVTNCINAVDSERSQWEKLGPDPEDRIMDKPAFIASRFGEETIFKIPEDRVTSIYCVEFTGDPDDGEYKATVEHHGLTGLLFELVWTDETDSNRCQ